MKLLPRKPRVINKIYANLFGYFWLPCPICGENFGGHEWLRSYTLMETSSKGVCVCYKKNCKEEADKSNTLSGFTF